MKHIISIDIGSALTKAIEARENKNGLELLTLENFPTPFIGAEVNDTLLFEQLEKHIPLARLKASAVVITIPASATAFTFLDLPKLPQNELSPVIEREARRKIFPTPGEKDIIKAAFVSETRMKDEIQERRLIGSALSETIEKYMGFFTKRGVNPQFIGSTPIALMQYNLELQSTASKNLAFVDIGHKHTSIAVFKKNEIALIRSIPFACFSFIESISKKLKIPYPKAEALFISEEVADDAVADSWDYLLAELRRSFTYYKDITGGSRIEGIILSGGMMTLRKSVEYLRRGIGGDLETFELRPSRSFTVGQFTPADLITRGPLFITAFGLLTATKPQKIPPINFIPSSALREVRTKRIKFLSVNALVIIMLILSLINILMGINKVMTKEKLTKLKASFPEQEFSYVMEKAAEISALTDQLEQDKRVVDVSLRNKPPIERLFTVLSEAVSASTYVSEITIDFVQTDTEKQPQGPGSNDSIFSPPKTEGEKSIFSLPQDKSKKPDASAVVVKIRGNIVSDYETAQKELTGLYGKIFDSGIFSTVTYEKLKVEEIVIGANGQNYALTKVAPREFIIEGRIKAQ